MHNLFHQHKIYAKEMKVRKVTLNSQFFDWVVVLFLDLEAAKIHDLHHRHKINANIMKERKVTLNCKIFDRVAYLYLIQEAANLMICTQITFLKI